MRHAINRVDVVWGYLSQFLSVCSSLLMLPFILYYLNSEDVGVWYVFITMIGLVQLLEFGFLPTISRYVSYIYSGATDIQEENIFSSGQEQINVQLLANVISSAKKIYLIVAMISAVIILFGGTVYLHTLSYKGDREEIYMSWIIYGMATILQFYFGYYNSILKGRGEQTVLNKIIVASKLTNIAFTIPFLFLGLGIKSIAFGMLASAIVDRLLVRRALFSKGENEVVIAFKLDCSRPYTKIIWQKAKLMGLVQLGNFLTTRCSLLIVSSFVGLDAAAKYGFTLQITSVAVIVASMYFGLQMPRFSAEYVRGNTGVIQSLFTRAIGISWVLFLLYSVLLVSLGPFLLSLFSLNTTLLPTVMLCVFLSSAFLEMNHSLCTAYLTTKNKFVFAKAILITGIIITISSFLLGLHYGLWGMILSQFICQVVYNNWKWPLVVFRELNISFKEPILALRR